MSVSKKLQVPTIYFVKKTKHTQQEHTQKFYLRDSISVRNSTVLSQFSDQQNGFQVRQV